MTFQTNTYNVNKKADTFDAEILQFLCVQPTGRSKLMRK